MVSKEIFKVRMFNQQIAGTKSKTAKRNSWMDERYVSSGLYYVKMGYRNSPPQLN